MWFATGLKHQSAKQLKGYCSKSVTAAKVQVVQWIGSGYLDDLDYGC